MSTITRASVMACTMDAPQLLPGIISRGATQQRMPCDSNFAHTASAIVLSFDE